MCAFSHLTRDVLVLKLQAVVATLLEGDGTLRSRRCRPPPPLRPAAGAAGMSDKAQVWKVSPCRLPRSIADQVEALSNGHTARLLHCGQGLRKQGLRCHLPS